MGTGDGDKAPEFQDLANETLGALGSPDPLAEDMDADGPAQNLERPSASAPDTMDGEELDWSVGAFLDDVHRLFTRLFDRRMARLGLTRAQWRVLTFLFRRDGMTQSTLADLLEMERAPLGRLLDRLEESGWVERRADPGDKRAKRVFKTAKIDPLLPTLKSDAEEVLSGALNGLSLDERRVLASVLGRMKANLQAMDQAPNEPAAPAGQGQTPKPGL